MDAEKLVNERQKTHGDFDAFAALNQTMKRACYNWGLHNKTHSQREAVEMICHKLSRIVVGNAEFADHWDDIAGYAKLGKEGHVPKAGPWVKVPWVKTPKAKDDDDDECGGRSFANPLKQEGSKK